MIFNEQQHEITRARLQEFRSVIDRLEGFDTTGHVHEALHKVQLDAMRSQAESLELEAKEWMAKTTERA